MSGPISQNAAAAPATVANRPIRVSSRPKTVRAKRMKRLPLYDEPGHGRVDRTTSSAAGPVGAPYSTR
ncbi:hypothetical protein GCM10009534_08890 [Kribbella sandramycini]